MNTTTLLLILGCVMIGTLLIVYFISSYYRDEKKELKGKELKLKRINSEIDKATLKLKSLEDSINVRKIDTSVNLTLIQQSVLDIYEESNIKIPVEIMEELHHKRLYEEKEIFDYIENQRLYWKLECQKKPYRKVK